MLINKNQRPRNKKNTRKIFKCLVSRSNRLAKTTTCSRASRISPEGWLADCVGWDPGKFCTHFNIFNIFKTVNWVRRSWPPPQCCFLPQGQVPWWICNCNNYFQVRCGYRRWRRSTWKCPAAETLRRHDSHSHLCWGKQNVLGLPFLRLFIRFTIVSCRKASYFQLSAKERKFIKYVINEWIMFRCSVSTAWLSLWFSATLRLF